MLVFAACDDSNDATGTDASGDAPVDAPTDASVDAPTDVPVDAPADVPVDAPTDAPVDAPTDASVDAPVDGGPSDDAGACVPVFGVSAEFVVDTVYGEGSSPLEQLLNHNNALTVNFETYELVRGVDMFTDDFKTGVASDAWSVDFTGEDEAFLDSEIGAFLNTSAAFEDAVFDLSADSFFLYVLPTDTEMHPYMAIQCYGLSVATDTYGFPIPEAATYTGCNTIFYEFRGELAKDFLSETTTTVEVTYSCR